MQVDGYDADRYIAARDAVRKIFDAATEGRRLDEEFAEDLWRKLAREACHGDEGLLESVLSRETEALKLIARRRPLFSVGPRVEITEAAESLLETKNVDLFGALGRHMRGVWGNVDLHEEARNEVRLAEGNGVVSRYTLDPRSNAAEDTLCVATYPFWGLTRLTTLCETLYELEEPLSVP